MVEKTPEIQVSPDKLQTLQQQYLQDWTRLLTSGNFGTALASDKRFANPAWQENPLAAWAAASYQINGRALMGMVDAIETDTKTRNRIRFAVDQWMAAVAPSNFLALNPEAQKLALDTQGESIAKGLKNLVHDLQQGHVSMSDESAMALGDNIATTPGAVVFENAYFQLIEYKPLSEKVFATPMLLVPPCINKYYILDLKPDNSLIRYCVAQGHRTFVVSWRNPDESLAKATWDDYIEHALIKAITVTGDIAGAPAINTLGFCVGGTMLSTAVAVLAARCARQASTMPVASMTLLTTLLDFTDTGVLDVFIDEAFVKQREEKLGQGGLMKAQELLSTFSFLRPNDLVWNYVVGNYLKGETPPAFDLLYWNSDATNLPGPYYAWYLRNTYLENNLMQANKLTVCGESLDLGLITIPAYIYGSREDHIVPIGSAYASTQLLRGKNRFVMGASGHVAGVINPPAKNKRSYWVRKDGKLPKTHATWLNSAVEHPGSWWPDWSQWLSQHSGPQVTAKKTLGSRQYKVIEPAPGRYVKVRA